MSAPPHSKPPPVPMPGIAQTLAALLWMDRFESYLLRGPGMRTMKVPGLGEVVTVSDPTALGQLFTADPEIARAANVNRQVLPGLGDNSVMMLDSDRHLRMRKLLLPPFHGEAVRRYADLVEDVTAAEIATWPEGEPVPTHPSMQRITLETILRAVIGVSDRRRAERLRAVLPKVLETNPLAFVAEGRFPWLGEGLVGRLQPRVRARRQARTLIAAEIAAHRGKRSGGDILAELIEARDPDGVGLSDIELEDQLLTLLLAGHETTASALAFSFERLSRHPATLARLVDEVDAGEDDAYLDAVVSETLRCRPPVELTWRLLAAPLELGDYLLPEGTVVVPVIRGTHQSAAFEDANEFRPERFLDGKTEPYSLIPFGGGTRRCLGAAFARLEMKAVLRVALRTFELRPTSARAEARNRTRRFSTVPGKGGRVVVRRRQPVDGAASTRPSPSLV